MSGLFSDGEDMALFSLDGQRKYLCRSESRRFLRAASDMGEETRIFCHLLHFTGCRVSEALELTPRRLDVEGKRVVFRTLKRRKRAFRAVPVPAQLMSELMHLSRKLGRDERLWPCCRQTAWRRVKKVMAVAEIDGPQAAPRGLRHQFGVQALRANLSLPLTQRLLGHASPNTTVIYQQVAGDDERNLVGRLWRGYGKT